MNLWSKISLNEYEAHMSDNNVGQLEALESIFKEKIDEYSPKSLMIWGIAGGNGLATLNPSITKEVIGLDINSDYLEICRDRYENKIKNLSLHCCNLNDESLPLCNTNFIWAALIFEYIDIPHALHYATSCLDKDGIISILLQKDNGLKSVSSQYENINNLSSVLTIIDENSIKETAKQKGLILIEEKEYSLKSGKSFVVLDFKKI